MYAETETFNIDRHDVTLPEELLPISVQEKQDMVLDYKKDMDPESTIYACASCRVRVIFPKLKQPFKRPLSALSILQLTNEKVEGYLSNNSK